MPRTAKGLTAAKVDKAGPGRYGDGAGLYLLVREPKNGGPAMRWWVFRWVRNGKMREMGLGAAWGRTAVSLVEARRKARNLYDIVRDGRDPLAEKAATKASQLVAAAKATDQNQSSTEFTNFLNYGAGYQPGSAQMFH